MNSYETYRSFDRFFRSINQYFIEKAEADQERLGLSEVSTTDRKLSQYLMASLPTPVLRYTEEPDFLAARSGSSAYLRTGVWVFHQL